MKSRLVEPLELASLRAAWVSGFGENLMKGKRCPVCAVNTMHNVQDGHLFCPNCGMVAWRSDEHQKSIYKGKLPPQGSGKGFQCPFCKRSTVHPAVMKGSFEIHYCSKCAFVGFKA